MKSASARALARVGVRSTHLAVQATQVQLCSHVWMTAPCDGRARGGMRVERRMTRKTERRAITLYLLRSYYVQYLSARESAL